MPVNNKVSEMDIHNSENPPVIIFTWNDGSTHKVYWGISVELAEEKFQAFIESYPEHLPTVYVWYGDNKEELYIDGRRGDAKAYLESIFLHGFSE